LIFPRTVPSISTGSEPVTVPSMVTFAPKNVPPGCTGTEGRV
jgi:hypothetical protein